MLARRSYKAETRTRRIKNARSLHAGAYRDNIPAM